MKPTHPFQASYLRIAARMLAAGGVWMLAGIWLVESAQARTLQVGPGREFKVPSAAARVAQDGDRVVIDAGEYYDCAFWRANGLTIEAADPADPRGVVLTDKACGGKASFVLSGSDTILRGLTFTRIRVPDGNGAGIRAEGRNLVIERCAFTNNQTAILSLDYPSGHMIIRDSSFSANGACDDGECLGTLYIGRLARLRVERSSFRNPRGSQSGDGEPRAGAHIRSNASSVELIGNRIEDGDGASSALVIYPAHGSLLMSGNILEKGPRTTNARAAIFTGSGWGHADSLVFRHNTLINHTGHSTTFLLNWTDASPVLDSNKISAEDTDLSSRGLWWHRVRFVFAYGRDSLIAAKDNLRHGVGSVLRSLKLA